MSEEKAYIEVEDGSSVYCEKSGNPDGEPLVMLHGGLGSIRELDVIREYVSSDFRLIAIDFRGHGKSALGDKSLSYAQHQSDVQDVLSHLGVSKYSLFGFSDGGIVGYRLAAENPQEVTRLVALGGQWRLEPNDPSREILSALSAEFWCERFADDVAYYNASNPEPDFPKLVNAVKSVWLDTTDSGYPGRLVESIKCPTLIMRGDNDFLFSLEEAVALKAVIPGSSFANIPLASHGAHQEWPELVGRIVRKFMLRKES